MTANYVNPTSDECDILIVGGGIAGLSAAGYEKLTLMMQGGPLCSVPRTM